MLEALQAEVERIISSEDLIDKANEVKKLSDLIRDATENIMKIQRTLAIDRKTRKTDETDNFAGWLRGIKREAKKFVDDRLVKLYCPDCNVMIMRLSAVHDHTGFKVEAECSQCGKTARARREAKDIWFDLKKDAEWRRAHPVEIVPPDTKKTFSSDSMDHVITEEDELIIDGFGETHGTDS